MSFMERLHSALILHTPMYHPNEAQIIEQYHKTFLDAIRRGDSASVEKQILNGFDVDHAVCAHTPPLIYAILHERFDIVQTLLNYGADTNIFDHKHITPLHTAVKMQQDETIHLLIRYGADPKEKDETGISALELAYRLKSKLAVKTMKQTSSMLDQPESLFDAAQHGDLLSIAYADKLHDRLFIKNRNEQSLLHLAALSNNIKLVAYLLNKDLDIDAVDNRGNTPLNLIAHHNGYEAMMRYLIKRHATLDHKNSSKQSALMTALIRGHTEYVDILLEAGASIHTTDGLNTPLSLCHHALERFPDAADAFRRLETRLLIKGAHVDESTNDLHWTPLLQTVTRPQNDTIKTHFKLLIKLGANVNYRDRNGRTALMLSCSTGRIQIAQKLLANYANPDLIDNFGWSALMFAVYYNHVRLVHTLLEHGADVNATSEKGLTALKIANQYDRKLLIELLIDYGAIVEDENKE